MLEKIQDDEYIQKHGLVARPDNKTYTEEEIQKKLQTLLSPSYKKNGSFYEYRVPMERVVSQNEATSLPLEQSLTYVKTECGVKKED